MTHFERVKRDSVRLIWRDTFRGMLRASGTAWAISFGALLAHGCTLDRSGGDFLSSTGGGPGTGAAGTGAGGAGTGATGTGATGTGAMGTGATGAGGGTGATGGMGASGGMGGSGGSPPVVPTSCLTVVGPDGVYSIDPDGNGPTAPMDLYCEMDDAGGGWALLHNSVGSMVGNTPAFWNIPYAERLSVKGGPTPNENFYAGVLYRFAAEIRDEAVDMNGTRADLFRATMTGFDDTNMVTIGPNLVVGNALFYSAQFASGWSSPDFDNDLLAPGVGSGNCAIEFLNVTQHYGGCLYYSLGSDGDVPHEDGFWGPHAQSDQLVPFGLTTDGTFYSRVARISRWARW